MYTGHVALALASRRVTDDVPLWLLIFAAQAPDWVELSLKLVGSRAAAETWSHAYPWVVVAALATGGMVYARTHSLRGTVTVVLLYLSHPVADYVTGLKVFWVGYARTGLALVEQPTVDFFIQGLLCILGCGLYWLSVPASQRRRVMWAAPLVLLLSLQALADLVLGSGNVRVLKAFIVGSLSSQSSPRAVGALSLAISRD